MKALLAAGLLFTATAVADVTQPWRAVDLDRPGALEALERDNPVHFAKVAKILDEAPQRPFGSVAGWMRTEFDAKAVDTSYLLKTTYPAQARLTFVLDERQYTKVVRIDAPPSAMPAK